MTGEFPAKRASNADFFSIWWRHHASDKVAATCKSCLRNWMIRLKCQSYSGERWKISIGTEKARPVNLKVPCRTWVGWMYPVSKGCMLAIHLVFDLQIKTWLKKASDRKPYIDWSFCLVHTIETNVICILAMSCPVCILLVDLQRYFPIQTVIYGMRRSRVRLVWFDSVF